MNRGREAGKDAAQLANLRALPATPPRTKSGQVMWAWPEITAGLKSGRTMREVWEALKLDGIEVSYGQFRTYVSRIRKRGVPVPDEPLVTGREKKLAGAAPCVVAESSPQSAQVRDPLANLRESQAKSQMFDYHPELADPKKLI